MKDYEQLYYDALYEIKQLKKKLEHMQQELELYKNAEGKDLKKFIINEVMKYINKNKQKKEK